MMRYKKYLLLLIVVIMCILCASYNFTTPRLHPQYVVFKTKPIEQQHAQRSLQQSLAPQDSILYSQLSKNNKKNSTLLIYNQRMSKISESLNQDSFGQLTESHDVLDSFQRNSLNDEQVLDLSRIIKKHADKIFISNLNLGLYYINIGYTISIDSGKEIFTQIQELYNLPNDFCKVHKTLKKHRVFYAILIGPYKELKEANDLCKKIMEDGRSCFVVEDVVLHKETLNESDRNEQ